MAIDQLDDFDDEEDELEYMMEEEGMTAHIRVMMENMERSGVLMDNHDEDERHEMWMTKVS